MLSKSLNNLFRVKVEQKNYFSSELRTIPKSASNQSNIPLCERRGLIKLPKLSSHCLKIATVTWIQVKSWEKMFWNGQKRLPAILLAFIVNE